MKAIHPANLHHVRNNGIYIGKIRQKHEHNIFGTQAFIFLIWFCGLSS